jgi:dipeptidyl-peptidase-4
MMERYSRAVRMTAPKVAATTPGLNLEGYWIGSSRYFLLEQAFDESLGHVIETPAIFECESQRIETLIPPDVLASVLAGHAAQALDRTALASAIYDMPDAKTLAVTVGEQHFLLDWRARRVIESRAALSMPALYSPDGHHACFVKEHDLWIRELESGTERPLTRDGEHHNAYGRQAESDLHAVSYRRSPSPMALWSADSEWLFTHRIDERAVPELALVQHAPPSEGRPVLHRYNLPMPGDTLATMTFVAIHVASGRSVRFEEVVASVPISSPFYRYRRMAWLGDRDAAWFVRLDRYCKEAQLIRFDFRAGTARVVLSEQVDSGYLEFHQFLSDLPNVRTLERSREVIWFSERDGWGHLYLYDFETGRLKNRITHGEWLVRDIVHVDEQQRKIFFTACGVDPSVDPARRALCAVHLDGSDFEVLCPFEGEVIVARTDPLGYAQDRPFRSLAAQAGVSPDGRYAVVQYASVDRGNETSVVDLQTGRGCPIASAGPAAGSIEPRHFTALAADGATRLHGVMFLPSDFDERQRYPLIDYIYPGPQITQQPRSFRAANSNQARALAELGFVTIMCDTRGMPFRSRAQHQIGYGDLLEPQLADHAAIVRQLCEQFSFVDGERVGIFGQSGGGAATARALFDYGDVFKVGVAVCGNHDSRYYSAMWSDKYRGPGNPQLFAAQANGAAAHKLTGKLFLISGDMDENVHVSHTLALADALIRANRDFDLLIVPNAGHDVIMAHGYTLRRMWDYFVRHLHGAAPPADFKIEFAPHEVSLMLKNWMREIFR